MSWWKRRFYNSVLWRQVRALVIERDMGICRYCGEYIVDGPPEVHHVVELTEQNYADPEISLNPELLETLHHECHDARHGRFGKGVKETIVDDELNVDYLRREGVAGWGLQ